MKISFKEIYKFWIRIEKTPTCWNWKACKDDDGYGIMRIQGKNQFAHRISFLIHNGSWSKVHILHKCDNPSCVRPSHLFEGTDADNHADRNAKGRTARGERIGTSKLTNEEVLRVKHLLKIGIRQVDIVALTKIEQSKVSRICTSKSWAHLN